MLNYFIIKKWNEIFEGESLKFKDYLKHVYYLKNQFSKQVFKNLSYYPLFNTEKILF